MNAVIQNRKLVLVGLGVIALAVALLVIRPLLLGSSDEATTISSTKVAPPASSAPAPKPAIDAVPTPSKPRVKILPGVPAPVGAALQRKPVVVVSLYVNRSSASLAQARKGAATSGAGFVTVNLLREPQAKAVSGFAGANTSSTETLVVQRPGKIVNRFPGYVDRAIVAQAAVNAGAHPPKPKPAKNKAKAAAGAKKPPAAAAKKK